MNSPWYWNSDSNGTGDKSNYNNPYGQDLTYRLQQALAGGAFSNADFLSNYVDPAYHANIKQMLGMLSPAGAMGNAQNRSNSILNQSQSMGARQASLARMQGGSPALSQGILGNALNQGRTMATRDYAESTDPLTLLLKKQQVLGGAGMTPGTQWLSQLLGQAPATPQRGPSIFESLLGIGGQLAGAGAFNNVFGGGHK